MLLILGRTVDVWEGTQDRRLVAPFDPHDAFAAAMTAQASRLARLAFFLCGDPNRAEDVVADVFAAAWPKWSAGRVDDLDRYLGRAVANRASKVRRHRRVVARYDAQARVQTPSPGADEGLDSRIDLAHALASLPRHQRVVVVLRYLEDMAEADIASLLHVPPGTVKSRLARALDALRMRMEEHDA